MIPTDTVLPPELNVLQFDTKSRLSLRLRPYAARSAVEMMGGLTIHVFLAAAVSGILTEFFFSSEVTHLALTIAALLRWVWVTRRGTTLEILVDSRRYTLISPIGRYTRDGIPAFNVNTSRTAKGWTAELMVEGCRAATRFSRTSECCAADPFSTNQPPVRTASHWPPQMKSQDVFPVVSGPSTLRRYCTAGQGTFVDCLGSRNVGKDFVLGIC